jgi:hypothetical protein
LLRRVSMPRKGKALGHVGAAGRRWNGDAWRSYGRACRADGYEGRLGAFLGHRGRDASGVVLLPGRSTRRPGRPGPEQPEAGLLTVRCVPRVTPGRASAPEGSEADMGGPLGTDRP